MYKRKKSFRRYRTSRGKKPYFYKFKRRFGRKKKSIGRRFMINPHY